MGRPVRDSGGPGGGGICRPVADNGAPGGTGPRATGRGASFGPAGTSVGRLVGASRGAGVPRIASPAGRVGRGRSLAREEITRPGIGAGGADGVATSDDEAVLSAAGTPVGAATGSAAWGAGATSTGSWAAATDGAATGAAGVSLMAGTGADASAASTGGAATISSATGADGESGSAATTGVSTTDAAAMAAAFLADTFLTGFGSSGC